MHRLQFSCLNATPNLMVQYRRIDGTLAALADPTRRDLLERLGRGSATITELARAVRDRARRRPAPRPFETGDPTRRDRGAGCRGRSRRRDRPARRLCRSSPRRARRAPLARRGLRRSEAHGPSCGVGRHRGRIDEEPASPSGSDARPSAGRRPGRPRAARPSAGRRPPDQRPPSTDARPHLRARPRPSTRIALATFTAPLRDRAALGMRRSARPPLSEIARSDSPGIACNPVRTD
jgi:hypothetical protein